MAIYRADTITPTVPGWRWRGYIPLGELTMMTGSRGVGKTRIGSDLAARLSRGWPMPLDQYAICPPCGAVVMVAEDHIQCVAIPTLQLMQADMSRICILTPERGLPHDWIQIESAMQQVGAGLVFLDPYDELIPERADAQTVRKALRPGVELARKYNAAIVICQHVTKARGSAAQRAKGSTAAGDYARAGLYAGPHPDSPVPYVHALTISKRFRSNATGVTYATRMHFDPRPEYNEQVVIDWIMPNELTADEVAAEIIDDTTARQKAVAFLHDVLKDGPARVSEAKRLAREADITDRTFRRARKAANLPQPKLIPDPTGRYYVYYMPSQWDQVQALIDLVK